MLITSLIPTVRDKGSTLLGNSIYVIVPDNVI